MNVLVAVAKNESKYIKEWLDYHLNLGFDLIYLVDNGNNGTLDSLDARIKIIKDNQGAIQLKAYNAIYGQLKLGDVMAVLDIDEFLSLDTNIDRFVRENLQDCDCLRLSWQVYGDCGNVKYEKKPVLERFQTPSPIDCKYNLDLPSGITENWHTKYFVRKTWKPTTLGIHNPAITFGISRNVLGEKVDSNSPFMKPIWEKAFVKHFLTKSTEEFKKRRFSTKDACGNVVCDNDKLIERYFALNERTEEKEKILNAI
jgi:hypothetical protein